MADAQCLAEPNVTREPSFPNKYGKYGRSASEIIGSTDRGKAMKKIVMLVVALGLCLCSTASGFQGGGGESTKNPKPTPKPRRPSAPKPKVEPLKQSTTLPRTRTNQVGIEFVLIPAGKFMMGSNNVSKDEEPVHRVAISQPFYMGKYEVTQGQWQMVGNNPSYFKNCDNCPVEQVSWDDTQQFLARLNKGNDGFHYRLPSEAEWEYAARARATGDDRNDVFEMAWFYGNSGGKTHPVGQMKPNAWGLYDMHGNVKEWCQDWYHDNYHGAPTDGSAWMSGAKQESRVWRGSSWDGLPFLGSARRNSYIPDYRNGASPGFRIVAVVRTQ